MAKYFNDRVYNSKKKIINIVIIGLCIIGIIVCFIITSKVRDHKAPDNASLTIKEQVTVEVNQEITKDKFFTKVENVDLDKIKIKYSDNFNIAVPGEYSADVVVNGKNYHTNVIVVDTDKPKLTLKELTIKQGTSYKADDFVESCQDNDGDPCKIAFYTEGVDEEGNKVDYSSFSKVGTYSIKIVAIDNTGNQTVSETKLNITSKNTTPETPVTPPPVNCAYGSATYDHSEYTVAVDLSSNGCAVNYEKFKDLLNEANIYAKELNDIAETQTKRIMKDVENANLTGTFVLNRKYSAVVNSSLTGIVGYQITIKVSDIKESEEGKTVVEFKINKDGKRVFSYNPHNIPE